MYEIKMKNLRTQRKTDEYSVARPENNLLNHVQRRYALPFYVLPILVDDQDG